MALFKVLKGNRSALDSQALHDGYAYFCVDDGSFHIDVTDSEGVLQRKQVNAKDAETLTGMTLEEIQKSISWNELNDRPFGHYPEIVVEWDHEIKSGMTVVEGVPYKVCVKVSDHIPTMDQVNNLTYEITTPTGEVVIQTAKDTPIRDYGDYIAFGGNFIVKKPNTSIEGALFPEAGVYLYQMSMDTAGLIIYKWVFPEDIETIDEKFLPDTIARTDIATTENNGLMSLEDKAKVDNAVLHSEQTLTDAQKAQARENIGAVSQEDLANSAYIHPTYTAKSSGLYKVTVDGEGHVSGTTAVTKADITALGIPAQDTTYTLPAAGTSLGGVKSGGDVTISDGTITVNDDSHNHTIANVDGLQSALDAKAASSDVPTKVSQLTNDSGFTTNVGTITGVSANGTSVATSGVANIPAASTSAYGVTKLSSSTNDTSTTTAATPNAVKAAYDLANTANTTANAALPESGGTMTGKLTLAADPTGAMEAATMQWVQAQIESAIGTAIGGSY